MATRRAAASEHHDQRRPDAATIPVENPATGEIITTVPILGQAEVAEMAARAPGGAAGVGVAIGIRAAAARIMRRAQKWMLDNADRMLSTPSSPRAGKTFEDAQLADLGYTVSALGLLGQGGAEVPGRRACPVVEQPDRGGQEARDPLRAARRVGVIGPWNYPIANSFGDCIPALMAGNSVILKPSEVTPLSSLLMLEEMLASAGCPRASSRSPPATARTGQALIGQVDCVMFTGSSRTGKAVMKAAADALIPCYLELGGKDPMIVCADADLERAANAAAFYSMNNGGQVCISVERVYVEAPVYDEFVQRVTDNVRELRQGPPQGAGQRRRRRGDVPAADRHRRRARRDAVAKGAKVLVGGHRRPGDGPVLRADRARRRRPLDEVHAGGDLRPDAADHEGRPTPRRRSGWPTTPTTACRRACGRGRRSRRAARPAYRGRSGVRQRRPGELHRPQPADGRVEDLRPRDPPRRERDPQVHQGPVAAHHPSRAEARAVHVPVQGEPHEDAPPDVPRACTGAASGTEPGRSDTTDTGRRPCSGWPSPLARRCAGGWPTLPAGSSRAGCPSSGWCCSARRAGLRWWSSLARGPRAPDRLR